MIQAVAGEEVNRPISNGKLISDGATAGMDESAWR